MIYIYPFRTAANGFIFAEIPYLNSDQIKLSKTLSRSSFSGKPSQIYGVTEEQLAAEAEEDANPPPPPEEDEEPAPPPVRPVRVTELQRLAYTVKLIDQETSIVPAGAYILTETGAVIPDSTFRGLSYTDSLTKSAYLHFRPATDPAKLRTIAGDAATYQSQFLDSIDDDTPAGCWVVRTDAGANATILRSLLWPGYSAYHIPGTSSFGGAYFGPGNRNSDLAFLLF